MITFLKNLNQSPNNDKPHKSAGVAVFLFVSVFCLTICQSDFLSANVCDIYGISTRGIGMGNAMSAIADDGSAIYYNPAGLALNDRAGMSGGYIYGYPQIKLKDKANNSSIDYPDFDSNMNGIFIDFKQHLGGLLPDRWSRNIGIGIQAMLNENLKKAAFIRTYLNNDVQFPIFGKAHDDLYMGSGLGIQLNKMIYLGIGMRVGLTMDIRDFIMMNDYARTGEFDSLYDFTSLSADTLDVNMDTEGRLIAGIILKPWETLHIGVVLRKEGHLIDLCGAAALKSGILDLSMGYNFSDFYEPAELAASIAYRFSENFLCAIEVTRVKWSEYDVPLGNKPPGEPIHDIVVPRFGLEYTWPTQLKYLSSLQLMMGYYYRQSAVKSVQPYTCFMDSDEHVFSCATEFSLEILDRFFYFPLYFSYFFQYRHLPLHTLHTVNGPISISGYNMNIGGSAHVTF